MNLPFEQIKKLRLQKNISQIDMAKAAGISRGAYIAFEKGNSESLSLKSAVGVAQKLNVPFVELFDIEPKGKEHNEFIVLLLINYVFAVLSHYSLLMQLSAHEELSAAEQRNYNSQLSNLKDGVYKTFKTYKEKGYVDNEVLTTVLEAYPSLNTWQKLLEPVKKLID